MNLDNPIDRVIYAIGEFPMAVYHGCVATIGLIRDHEKIGWGGVYRVSKAIWHLCLLTCIHGPIVEVRVKEVPLEAEGGESR